MASDTDWLTAAYTHIERMTDKAKEIRERSKLDLYFFARLMNPGYIYGDIHKEVFKWLQDYTLYKIDDSVTTNKLILLPRAHLKSHMVAVWCAWIITCHPEVTILYLSATAELAELQLFAIKSMLDSPVYKRYFPEYLNPQEGLREKWSTTKIAIDHPIRREQGVRDATVATAGITTNSAGWHADIVVADDLVVPDNAYTEGGRDDVAKAASQLTSIRNPGGFTIACGTRYHPNDIYGTWKDQTYNLYNPEGEIYDVLPVWEIKQYAVEQDGVFLWPRTVRSDGKAFGFNHTILSRIKAEYIDRPQFFAQYYNDPNDSSSDRISRDRFQYYDIRRLKKEGSSWTYNGNRLNVYAAVDFAFSLGKTADWTSIVVTGVDADGNYYVLDIDRFKTNKTKEYFDHIAELHSKWRFNKLRAEVTVAQVVIVEAIKDYIKQQGMTISIDEYRPSRIEGSKEQRIAAALEHLYDNLQMWHPEGGWVDVLEEELVQARPQHDDIKDALASAVTIAVKPQKHTVSKMKDFLLTTSSRSRFGGVAFR